MERRPGAENCVGHVFFMKTNEGTHPVPGEKSGAEILIESLVAQGVEFV